MDELEISGKRYISTRRAAREHGYHSDYMGQLIRGGKVAGKKVGRSWYIDEQSLAIYLGKALQPVQLERLEQPVQEAQKESPQEPVIEVQKEELLPEPQLVEEIKAQEIKKEEQPEEAVQEIIAEVQKEEAIKIPIHIPKEALQEIGGLRYAPDDSPQLPIITRMPRQAQAAERYVESAAPTAKFPIISLSVVGLLALGAALFASNFVTANIVKEEGKAATVQYAIHW